MKNIYYMSIYQGFLLELKQNKQSLILTVYR